jgi:hypothetical protein
LPARIHLKDSRSSDVPFRTAQAALSATARAIVVFDVPTSITCRRSRNSFAEKRILSGVYVGLAGHPGVEMTSS